jgi:hypothetical protein
MTNNEPSVKWHVYEIKTVNVIARKSTRWGDGHYCSCEFRPLSRQENKAVNQHLSRTSKWEEEIITVVVRIDVFAYLVLALARVLDYRKF